MKNLFEINEDEKNRILGLHESATKNHYLINEQEGRVVDNYNVAQTLGFGVSRTMSNNCQRVMILDGNGYQNLVSNVCPNGYIDFKNEIKYEDTTISGSWVVSDQNVTITMSDGTKFTGNLVKDSLKNQVTSWLVKQPKFAELVKDQSSDIQDTWKSWGGGESQTKTENSVGSKQGITWDIAVKRWPCFANIKDKTIYNDGNYDYVIYQIGGLDYYVYIGDGHVYNPSTKEFTSTYLGKDFPCDPVVQPMPEPGVGRGQENPNVARIKELQRKVGVKDDGILGKMTLKAIMDKLSQ